MGDRCAVCGGEIEQANFVWYKSLYIPLCEADMMLGDETMNLEPVEIASLISQRANPAFDGSATEACERFVEWLGKSPPEGS